MELESNPHRPADPPRLPRPTESRFRGGVFFHVRDGKPGTITQSLNHNVNLVTMQKRGYLCLKQMKDTELSIC